MRRSPVPLAAALLAATSSLPALAAGGDQSITLTPANSIQATINSGLYAEIVLSPGIYNQVVDFNGEVLTLRSTDPDDPAVVAATVLDGSNLGTSVIVFDDGEGPDSRLVGLTITGGTATTAAPNDRGGGIRCFPGSPTIDRCVVVGNQASGGGGGLYVSGGQPTIVDSVFLDNTADQGGGIYLNMTGFTIELVGLRVEGNVAPTAGGGIRTQGGSLRMRDCELLANETAINGGGLYANNTDLDVRRTRFTGNLAERGGGIYTLQESVPSVIADSVLEGNVATATGGGAYFRTPVTVRNATVVQNAGGSAGIDAATGTTTVISSILWNNVGSGQVGGAGTQVVRFSVVQGGFAGPGNLDVDPQFVAAGDGTYELAAGSPAIDAGDTSALADEYPLDFLGNARAVDDFDTPDTGVARLGINVDVGAFEFQPEPVGGDPTCPEDVDGNGVVEFADLLSVLGSFGACG